MATVLLIPGYATRLHVPIFRSRGLGTNLGFTGFRERFKNGECAVVDWGLEQHVAWWNILNPWAYYRAYRTEELYMLTEATLGQLRIALERHRPEVVIAHSMGARLLGRLLASEKFSFLQEVHLVMSDDHRVSPAFSSGLRVFHHYCPWDVTLWLSSIIHVQWRAGLWPSPLSDRSSVFLWLIRPFNLHTAPLRSPSFARKVCDTYAVRSPRD